MTAINSSAYIDPSATVEDGVLIGKDTKVWALAHLRRDAKIGDRVVIGRGVQVDCGVVVGSGSKIQNGVALYVGVTIEDDVFVGPFAVFTNDLNPRAFNIDWQVTPTLIRRGASIGANATIVCGNEIGEYAMVAAGAVVTKSVKPYQLVGGVPAQHMGWVNKDGELVSKTAKRPNNLN